jgi:hypothetical protein
MKEMSTPELIRFGFWNAVGGAVFSGAVLLALLALGALTVPQMLPKLESKELVNKTSPCGCS